MAYTENDVFENIMAGNVYLKPNIQGTFTFINDTDTLFTVDRWNISDGTISVNAVLQGADNPPKAYYSYFKDDSYLKLTLNETWSTGTLRVLTALGYSAVLGIKNAETGTITEVSMSNVGGLPTTKTIYTLNPSLQQWDAEECLYTAGDIFRFSLTWWAEPSNKLRMLFIPALVQTAGFMYSEHLSHLDENIMTGGVQSQLQLITADGQAIAEFFCGQTSEGTQYPGDDSSDSDGGHGTFYNENDAVTFTPLPSLQAIDFGFNTIYNPNESDMRAICSWLWSDDFTVNIKKNYASPFENILSLAIIPVAENTIETTLGTFVVGNTDSNIQTNRVTDQYLRVDCGTKVIPEYWQNFLDYNTNFSIWLPYIGFRPLKPEDILQATKDSGGNLHILYTIDLLTGATVCEIQSILKDRQTGNLVPHLLYSYNTNIFYQMPVSGANFATMYSQQLSATASGINNAVKSIGQIAGGDIIGGVSNLLTGTATSKMAYDTAKPDYGRAGASGGNAGRFSYKRPYIIRTQAIGNTPANYKSLQGIPADYYKVLSELTGYTEIDTVVADTLTSCTDTEKTEIISLLKGGVIL